MTEHNHIYQATSAELREDYSRHGCAACKSIRPAVMEPGNWLRVMGGLYA